MMVAEVVTATGWSWEYTRRHMDLHRYGAMRRLWRRSPPLQAMVQGYLGIDPPDAAPAVPAQRPDDDIALFTAAFSAAGITLH